MEVSSAEQCQTALMYQVVLIFTWPLDLKSRGCLLVKYGLCRMWQNKVAHRYETLVV